jgi:hypothetical protein
VLANPVLDPVEEIPEFKVCIEKIEKVNSSDRSIF